MAVRFWGDYDYNLGWPGSRIRNPDPKSYDDIHPPMGPAWWVLIGAATVSFFWGYSYDTSRKVDVAAGIFGVNMPL